MATKSEIKTAPADGPRQPFEPTNNQIKINNKRKPQFFINITKFIYLEKYEEVQLHSLGQPTAIAVRVAENLQRHGIATISKIQTSYIENDAGGKRVKLIIFLKRATDYRSKVPAKK